MNDSLVYGRVVGKKNDGIADCRDVGKKIDFVNNGLADSKDDRFLFVFAHDVHSYDCI